MTRQNKKRENKKTKKTWTDKELFPVGSLDATSRFGKEKSVAVPRFLGPRGSKWELALFFSRLVAGVS